MTSNQLSLETVSLYNELCAAFSQATIDEASIKDLIDHQKTLRHKEILVLLERFDKATTSQLPEAFGRFISGLDLQNSFLHLGRYVRSFEDAAFVIKNMEASMLTQTEKISPAVSYQWITDLTNCCKDLSMIRISLINASLEA